MTQNAPELENDPAHAWKARQVEHRAYVRDRICVDCGKQESVRKDNSAERCRSCSARSSGAKGIATIIARRRTSTCEQCGAPYHSKVGQRFCQMACRRAHEESRRLKSECPACGTAFQRPISILRTNAAGRFCSKRCYHTHLCRTDKVTGRGSRWRAIRKQVLALFPFCALCGTTGHLQVHHIIPFRLSRDNDPANLIPLCTKHHRFVESAFVETEATGMGDHSALVWQSILRERQMATLAKLKSLADAA